MMINYLIQNINKSIILHQIRTFDCFIILNLILLIIILSLTILSDFNDLKFEYFLLRFIINLKEMTANTREEHLYMAKITEQT
jgi:hypothetical protein